MLQFFAFLRSWSLLRVSCDRGGQLPLIKGPHGRHLATKHSKTASRDGGSWLVPRGNDPVNTLRNDAAIYI